MKVKDFIEVYDDAYLTIETKEAVYTDCPNYVTKADTDGYYNVPIVLFKGATELDTQVLEKEIFVISSYELDYTEGISMFFVGCGNSFNEE